MMIQLSQHIPLSAFLDISTWMKDCHLELNRTKTELLVILANPSLEHGETSVYNIKSKKLGGAVAS